MSYAAGRSHLPTPTSSPTHERISRSDPIKDLHDKYVFYAMRMHDSTIKIQEHIAEADRKALYDAVTAEFNTSSNYPTPASTPKDLEGHSFDDFWRKCGALCPPELGNDPRGWCQQYFASFLAMQFIMNQRDEAAGIDINAWREEIHVILASTLSGNVPVNEPRPGVLGQARLLDWVGSSFIGKNGVKYLVQDGGTTVANGPFYMLCDPDGELTKVSANEFEKMVEGQEIPVPKVDDYID
ncbi:hypothetical protein OF83DRAFT_1133580 [Amylostereum chailletii]|nr:hypothetical protein OF83DRAFT_1133580 [Amylostereum chailletii]